MNTPRLVVVSAVVVTLGCSENKNPGGTDAGASFADAAAPCSTRFAADDAGQPATITVDTSAVVNTFVPKLLFGNNVAWYFSKRDLQATQAKVQAAGNYSLRYPGGSSSDDHHWNGTGSYDTNHYWVPSSTSFAPGFQGTERFRGTTSGSYQTPAFITDGDPTTRWLSNVDTTSPAEQWVYVDLGRATSVDTLAISWGTPFAASFRVETWSSTAAWSPPYWATSGSWQVTSAGTMTGTEGVQTVSFAPVTTRFIRVLMTASSAGPSGAYSIAEIVAYSGSTQVTSNVASMSQSPTTASSTDPANDRDYQVSVDFESFMTYVHSFTPPADPIITVNVGTGSPQEAAAWVHYANVVKSYGIHYWQIGNEMEANWETGGPLNARDYVSRYVQYYDAMKAEDPSILVLGPVSGGMNEPSNLGDGKSFIEDFIHILAARGQSDHVDGIDFHWYPNWESVSAVPSPHETMPGITSNHAAHVACRIADLYGYCSEGFDLAVAPADGGETNVPYDISRYSGLVFWGMSPTANRVKVMVQNIDTDAKGGRCGVTDASSERCWDNFSTFVGLTDSWQRFEVKFSELEQEGWGRAAPGGVFDSTKAYSIYFQVNGPAKATDPAVNADVWIDDLYFFE